MNGLVTIASEPTGNAREFDINERIASFPTIYDTLCLYGIATPSFPILRRKRFLPKICAIIYNQRTQSFWNWELKKKNCTLLCLIAVRGV